jgi:hypothetical protein
MSDAQFDTTNKWVCWMLHVYNNRRYDGEIWLAAQRKGRMFCVEQSKCPDDAEVLGEIKPEIRDGKYHFEIVPLQQRSADELTKMAQQAERHRQYRQECYRRYSLSERIKDLG